MISIVIIRQVVISKVIINIVAVSSKRNSKKLHIHFHPQILGHMYLSYYDISLLYSRIHLKWISLCYCAKSWRQNYLWVNFTLKTTPPTIFLDPVYRSGSTILLYYLKTYFDINKALRNLTPFRQHVLLIKFHLMELGALAVRFSFSLQISVSSEFALQ